VPFLRSSVEPSSETNLSSIVAPPSKSAIFLIAERWMALISILSSRRTRAVSFSMITFERASSSTPSRVKTWASITVPRTEEGTRREVSLTSPALSPKIALRSFSSGESWVSPFGVILPTRISPVLTIAPTRIIPASSRSFKASSETLGISRVISSLPSLVSRASTS